MATNEDGKNHKSLLALDVARTITKMKLHCVSKTRHLLVTITL